MATTRIWAVKSRADHVLDYAMNPEKTINPGWSKDEYQTMRDVMDYAMNDAKTEQQYYVTALNCNPTCARNQMQMVKERFVRLRSLGEAYTEDAICQRILCQRVPERPASPKPQKAVRIRVYGNFHLPVLSFPCSQKVRPA